MAAKRIKVRARKNFPVRGSANAGTPNWAGRASGWVTSSVIANNASRWLATGTLVACSAVGTTKVALAQQPAQGGGAAPQSSTLSVYQFSIPRGVLGDVARSFETVTGRRIVFDNESMREIMSPGVSGPLSLEAALRQMLTDTGLAFRLRENDIILELRISTSIDVTESIAVPQVSSPRYTSSLRDIPQTISIVNSAVIQQQGATTLRDVLRNVPGVTMTAGEGGAPAGDNITLRGNSARNDIFIDGSRDLSSQSRDPYNMEQVEVTKGPTSVVTGRGSAGGTLNLVSKVPTLAHSVGGSFAFGNADTRRGSIDINTPVGFLGERTGFRLNGLYHVSGVPGRNDVVRNDRWGFAPALTFGIGTSTRLTLQYYKLKQSNISDYGIPWVTPTNVPLAAYRDKPAPVPRETFYGLVDRDKEFLNQDSATVRFEHEFSDNFTFRNQLRYGRAGRNSFATPPRFTADINSTAINRELRSWGAQDYIWDNQTDVTARFNTGRIGHAVNMGAAFSNEKNLRINRTGPNSLTTLLNPNPYDVYTGVITTSPFEGNITANTQAVWAFDTIRLFNDHIEMMGGVRWERFDANGVSTTPAPVQQTVNMPNYRAGITYKPVRAGSIYFAYGTSTSPSLEGLSYGTSNTLIPPEKTQNSEVGVKWDLLGGRVLAQSALFRVAKDNARTPGLLPTDPPQVLAGTQVSKGVELSLTGAINRNLRVLGSYTLIDARIQSSNTPAEVGRYFQNTPRNSASVWATYSRGKFSAGLGPRWVGKRWGNNINTRWVDSYWTVDMMLGYTYNQHLDFRFNLSNLNDRYYFDRLGGGHLIPGQARTALFATNVRF